MRTLPRLFQARSHGRRDSALRARVDYDLRQADHSRDDRVDPCGPFTGYEKQEVRDLQDGACNGSERVFATHPPGLLRKSFCHRVLKYASH